MVYVETTLASIVQNGGINFTSEHQERLEEANRLKDGLAEFLSSLYGTGVPKPPVEYLILQDFINHCRDTRFLRTTFGGDVQPYYVEELAGTHDDENGGVIKLNPYHRPKRDGIIIAHELGHATLLQANPPFQSTRNGFGMLLEEGDYHEAIAKRFEIDSLPFLRQTGIIGPASYFFTNLGNKLSSRGRTIRNLIEREGVTMKELLMQPHEVLKKHQKYFSPFSV